MHHFTDKTGKAHNVVVDINTLRTVEAQTNFKLSDMWNGGTLLASLKADVLAAGMVLAAVCVDDANDDDFLKALNGDNIHEGLHALVKASAEFIGPRKGKALLEIWDRAEKVEQAAHEKMMALLDGPDFNKLIEKTLRDSGNDAAADFLKEM